MAQILIRKLEPQLKDRAKRHRRSMEEEAREILRGALNEGVEPAVGFGTATAALFRGIGLRDGEEIAEMRGFKPEPVTFDE